jgi:hypothetical protein
MIKKKTDKNFFFWFSLFILDKISTILNIIKFGVEVELNPLISFCYPYGMVISSLISVSIIYYLSKNYKIHPIAWLILDWLYLLTIFSNFYQFFL